MSADREPGATPFWAGLFIPFFGALILGAVAAALLGQAAGTEAANNEAVIVANFGLILIFWGLLAHATFEYWRRRGEGRLASIGIHVSALGWIVVATGVGYLMGHQIMTEPPASTGLIVVTADSFERGIGIAAQVLVALMVVYAVDWAQHRGDNYLLRLAVTGIPFTFVAAATLVCVYASLGTYSGTAVPEDVIPLTLAGLGAGMAGAATLFALPPLGTGGERSAASTEASPPPDA